MTPTPQKDRQDIVLELLLRRDAEGMRQLFHHYGGALMTIIGGIVPQKEIAEEVLQDVLLKVWKKAPNYDASKSRFFTWMARIARNQAIDRTRSKLYRQNRKTDTLPDYVGNHSPLSHTPGTDHIGLRGLLDRLDDNHRQLIELLYLREYSQSEAAKSLGIPLGTVKTRSRRAIQQLRQLLGREMIWLIPILSPLLRYFAP